MSLYESVGGRYEGLAQSPSQSPVVPGTGCVVGSDQQYISNIQIFHFLNPVVSCPLLGCILYAIVVVGSYT